MSESRVTILASVKGLENIDKLKSAFRGLEQAIGPTDQAINKAREDIFNFANAGKQTEQVIRGQISALEGLRTQATIGGDTYRRLAGDLGQLESRFAAVTAEMRGTRSAAQEFSNAMTGIIGSSANVVGKQISTLKERIKEMKYGANELVATLQRVKELETVSSARAGRNQVTAAANAYAGPVLNTGFGSEARLPGMPDTSAALSQRIGELTEKLNNLRRNSTDYTTVAIELANVQRQLQQNLVGVSDAYQRIARDEESAIRRAAKLADIQRDAVRAPNVGGYRDPATGAIIARGSNDRSGYSFDQNFGPNYGPAKPSELFQGISAARLASINNQAQLMGKSFQEVATEIRLTTKASDGSINSLQTQRGAWQSLANAVKRGSNEYKEAQREMTAIDRQLESGKGGRLQRFGQTAGAVAASGVFGGPEGFVGSVIGGVVRGPGGALAGGAVGAQVGQIRQQAGQAAEYVKQLNLAKITLAQASTGQAEYNKLLLTARTISSDYAVGLKETITGYAQVAVAARANNLSLAQTESVYRGLIAAGVAFGKSQEDLDAIVTASVQVLSKGKLSAEELQGQIGERLPGAVAKFAEATGRSLPQLAKDLQSGKVAIADFVKFAESNVKDYDQIARIIGSGPEKAGARLKLALDTAAETYGDFLQKTGSQTQDYLTRIVANINNSSEGIKRFITFFVNNLTNLVKLIDGALDGIEKLTGKDFNRVPDSRANEKNFLADSYEKYTSNYNELFSQFNPSANMYGKGAPGTGRLDQLDTKPDTSPALKDQLALALAQEQAAKNTYKTNVELARTDQLRVALSTKIVEYNKIERDFAEGKLRQKEKEYTILKMESEYRTRVNAIEGQAQEERKRAAEKLLSIEKARAEVVAQQGEAMLQFAQTDFELQSYGKTDLESAKQKVKWLQDIEAMEMGSFNRKAKATMLEANTKGTGAETQALLVLQKETLKDQQEIRRRNNELQLIELTYSKQLAELEARKQTNSERLQAKRTVTGLQIGLAKSLGQSTSGLERTQLQSQKEERRQQIADSQSLLTSYTNQRGDLESKGAAQQIAQLDILIGKERESLQTKQMYLPIMDDLELKQQKLNEFAERYGGIFDQIGSGLTKTFDLLVTGTDNWGKSLKMIASTVLQDIARQLLKVLVIDQAINAFKNIFSPVKSTGAIDALFNPPTAAKGMVLASNGIQPFAMGGIVNRPTLFPFAKGIGLMGEAGPEAIMPLRRGADGKLGVIAGGGGGSTTINVSVDAKGTSVQGDGSQGAALARAIAGAVQTELIKQKRPGGILT